MNRKDESNNERKDEIVKQVRAAREAYAAQFDFDLAEMYKDLKAREQAGQHKVANIAPAGNQPDPRNGHGS